MGKILKQIIQISDDGHVRYLILEIKPNHQNSILYKWQAQIFDRIDANFVPTTDELVRFNDFLVNQIRRAKVIIPTFKDHFDAEVNLIIPNDLQTISTETKGLRLHPDLEGKYIINSNLLKGFKEEILDSIKSRLDGQTITNFNFTELIVGKDEYKLKHQFRDFEVGVPDLEVRYRVTKMSRSISDALVKTLNNLKLKVTYIWGVQDLLSFKITHHNIIKNNFKSEKQKIMIYDWNDHEIWVTADYLNVRQSIKINFGMNAIYQKVALMLDMDETDAELIKNYLTQLIDLNDKQIENWTVLKLKTLSQNDYNIYKIKDLKEKLVKAYLETLNDVRDELYFRQGINDVDLFAIIHFGKINELTHFDKFIREQIKLIGGFRTKQIICHWDYQQKIQGLYHPDYEDLITMGEWIRVRIEKSRQDRHRFVERTMLNSDQEHLFPNVYQTPRAAYSEQHYTSLNQKASRKH